MLSKICIFFKKIFLTLQCLIVLTVFFETISIVMYEKHKRKKSVMEKYFFLTSWSFFIKMTFEIWLFVILTITFDRKSCWPSSWCRWIAKSFFYKVRKGLIDDYYDFYMQILEIAFRIRKSKKFNFSRFLLDCELKIYTLSFSVMLNPGVMLVLNAVPDSGYFRFNNSF